MYCTWGLAPFFFSFPCFQFIAVRCAVEVRRLVVSGLPELAYDVFYAVILNFVRYSLGALKSCILRFALQFTNYTFFWSVLLVRGFLFFVLRPLWLWQSCTYVWLLDLHNQLKMFLEFCNERSRQYFSYSYFFLQCICPGHKTMIHRFRDGLGLLVHQRK